MSTILKNRTKTAGAFGVPLTDSQFQALFDVSGDGQVDNDDIVALGNHLSVSYQPYLLEQEAEQNLINGTKSDGVSTGAVAGIVVGVVSLVLIVVFVLVRNAQNGKESDTGMESSAKAMESF